MWACKRNMTELQRRSVRSLAVTLLLLVAIQMTSHILSTPAHPLPRPAMALQLASVVPILLAVGVAGRYLSAEPDEFVRALVVRAMLWGFAVTMVGDAVLGALMMSDGRAFPLGLYNADLFLIATGLAFRLLQRGYR